MLNCPLSKSVSWASCLTIGAIFLPYDEWKKLNYKVLVRTRI